jgi:hypothetical protein
MSDPLPLKRPASVKELKLKLTEATKEIERFTALIEELENLPILHEDLQARVTNLARIIFYLEDTRVRLWEERAAESMAQILSADLDELKERKAIADKKAAEAAAAKESSGS